MSDQCSLINGSCYNRNPQHRRTAHPRDTFVEHRVEDNGDGTWVARGYLVNVSAGLDRPSEARSFPSKEEAEVYSRSRNDGGLDVGALMRVHDWRLAKARGHA